MSCPTPPSLLCPYASSGAVLDHLAALDRGALGDRHHRVVAGVRGLVLHQERGQAVDVERDLRDDRPVDAGQVRRDQRRLAAVTAEHLDHRQPLVGPGARAQLMHEVHRARDGRREPDAVVGAVHVVVHRLRDRDDRDRLPGAAAGRTRACRRPRSGSARRARDARSRGARVPCGRAGRRPRGPRPGTPARRRPSPSPDSSSTSGGRCRRSDRSSCTTPGSRCTLFLAIVAGSSGFDLEEPSPAAPDPHHLVTLGRRPHHDGLDRCVQPGNVAPAGQDAHPHGWKPTTALRPHRGPAASVAEDLRDPPAFVGDDTGGARPPRRSGS